MAEDQEQAQKTEEPTPKRIEDAIKRGHVAFSREITSFVMLVMLSVFVLWIAPPLLKTANFEIAPYVVQPHEFEFDGDADDPLRLALKIVMELALLMSIPFVISIISALLGSFIQNGIIISPEAIGFKFDKINPLTGFKRIFSINSVVEFVKGILKISLIGIAAYMSIRADLDNLEQIHMLDFSGVFDVLSGMVFKMLITICTIMAVISVLDLIYQKQQYKKSLMMTKQEVKEEMKQTDGNPEIKAKMRAIRLERARRRMIAEIPKATVVITNPTHFSVALRYESGAMQAPQVIAKGQDNMALQIRKIAKKHNIPIVENKPLARALFDTVELDEFIPYEHYKAVAEIISEVMKFAIKQ